MNTPNAPELVEIMSLYAKRTISCEMTVTCKI
jgi:hypothetical protein